jgi:hypothetical protein
VVLLEWLWLVSPFVVIGLIAQDARLQALVAEHYERCRAIGCAGAAAMLLGVVLVPGPVGVLMFVIGTPAVGLAVWRRGDDGGDGPPDVAPIDWDEFERLFWAHIRRNRPRGRPRIPAG